MEILPQLRSRYERKERIMNKIKPCPFCGGDVIKRIAPLMKTVMFVCDKCGADVCFYGAEHEPKATIAWNRRAERREE